MLQDNHSKFEKLRKKHPVMHYENCQVSFSGSLVRVDFQFSIDGLAPFHPFLEFRFPESISGGDLLRKKDELEELAYRIGLVELISYWKSACPPRIHLSGRKIDAREITWWKKLYLGGLGEFIYVNRILADPETFLSMEGDPEGRPVEPFLTVPFSGGEKKTGSGPGDLTMEDLPLDPTGPVLIPVGGGKDSAVTMQLLQGTRKTFYLAVNPIPSSERLLGHFDPEGGSTVRVKRVLDAKLLELNREGYLNGHTPFSAMIAFVSLFVAHAMDLPFIALSNESSANEINTIFHGHRINHQYSKTLEFENDFRSYVRERIGSPVEYFSFLRPWHEYRIAKEFAKYEGLHSLFNSCNRGGREGIWCGKCSKCLFTAIILLPFLSRERIAGIFGRDLFTDPELIPVFEELIGFDEKHKPLECVGTYEEVRFSLCRGVEKEEGNLPVLLQKYIGMDLCGDLRPVDQGSRELASHNLPDSFLSLMVSLE